MNPLFFLLFAAIIGAFIVILGLLQMRAQQVPSILDFGGGVAGHGVGTTPAGVKPQAHSMDGESANLPVIQSTCPKGAATTIPSQQLADAKQACWEAIEERMRREKL